MRSRRDDQARRDEDEILDRTESTSRAEEEREGGINDVIDPSNLMQYESGEVEACFAGTDFQPCVTDEAMCG